MKKKTLKQWQKENPNAFRIEAKAAKLLSTTELIHLAFGKYGKGKVLQDSSYATWTQKSGIRATINAIVTPID